MFQLRRLCVVVVVVVVFPFPSFPPPSSRYPIPPFLPTGDAADDDLVLFSSISFTKLRAGVCRVVSSGGEYTLLSTPTHSFVRLSTNTSTLISIDLAMTTFSRPPSGVVPQGGDAHLVAIPSSPFFPGRGGVMRGDSSYNCAFSVALVCCNAHERMVQAVSRATYRATARWRLSPRHATSAGWRDISCVPFSLYFVIFSPHHGVRSASA